MKMKIAGSRIADIGELLREIEIERMVYSSVPEHLPYLRNLAEAPS